MAVVGGTTQADLLYDPVGDDAIDAFDGDDIIIMSEGGSDLVLAAFGFDTVSYENFSHGITVDLELQTADDGVGSHDSLINVERVVGTPYLDDISGDSADNEFDGGASADVLNGGLGSDRLYGGIP